MINWIEKMKMKRVGSSRDKEMNDMQKAEETVCLPSLAESFDALLGDIAQLEIGKKPLAGLWKTELSMLKDELPSIHVLEGTEVASLYATLDRFLRESVIHFAKSLNDENEVYEVIHKLRKALHARGMSDQRNIDIQSVSMQILSLQGAKIGLERDIVIFDQLMEKNMAELARESRLLSDAVAQKLSAEAHRAAVTMLTSEANTIENSRKQAADQIVACDGFIAKLEVELAKLNSSAIVLGTRELLSAYDKEYGDTIAAMERHAQNMEAFMDAVYRTEAMNHQVNESMKVLNEKLSLLGNLADKQTDAVMQTHENTETQTQTAEVMTEVQ